MKNKFKNLIDTTFGKQVKNRWKKILIFIVVIVITVTIFIGGTLFLIFNVGCNKKDGLFIKPIDAKIIIDKKV